MNYSTSFWNSILRKVLPPENQSVYQVSKETGIATITIYNWLTRIKDGSIVIEQGDDKLNLNYYISC